MCLVVGSIVVAVSTGIIQCSIELIGKVFQVIFCFPIGLVVDLIFRI